MDKRSDNRWKSRKRVVIQVIVDVVLWLAVGLPVLYLFLKGTPVERGFFCDDPSLSYPYKPDTISTPFLIIFGFSTSVFVIILVEVLNSVHLRCSRYCKSSNDLAYCTKGYAVFLLGFVVQEVVVETVKNLTGYLRPHFFAVCKPQFNASFCPGYISEYTCTGSEHDNEDYRDMRQSFPSGHSAFSMYIAVYFCFYIHYRLKIEFSRFLKFLLQSGLVFVALVCGLTRIQDNKHHPHDVIAGFLVGTIAAIAVYKTVGCQVLTNDLSDDTSSYDITDGPETFCCTCASSSPTTEPQTPAPLLENEFTESFTCRNNNTLNGFPKRNDKRLSNNVSLRLSSPTTHINRYEVV